VEGFHALLEILRHAQQAMSVAFDLGASFNRCILLRIDHALKGAFRKGREFTQFVHESIHCLFQFIVGTQSSTMPQSLASMPETWRERKVMSLVR